MVLGQAGTPKAQRTLECGIEEVPGIGLPTYTTTALAEPTYLFGNLESAEG